jgi:hypothetical protein
MIFVTIKSTRDGRTLRFAERKGEYFRVSLTSDSISATKGVYGYMQIDRLPALFDSIAADWKGWKGKKEWKTIESDLQLAATHDGLGHVRLEVRITNQDPEDNWTVTADLFFDAGSLDSIAKSINEYFNPTKTEPGAIPNRDPGSQ